MNPFVCSLLPAMNRTTALLLAFALGFTACRAADDHIVYEPKDGPGKGKHIVLVSGDEEYRSEEALPMLGKILSQRHGFKCTVLFSLGEDGCIDANNQASLSHPAALDSADGIILFTRFRRWNEEALKKFEAAVNRGIPIIGLRTATHAFNGIPKDSPYAKWNFNNNGGWGKAVLGETWVSHWGRHRAEATKGVIEPSAKDHPVLRGVADLFGVTDVYEAAPAADATILVRGQVLKGMTADSGPADYKKKNRGGAELAVNEPAMPVIWTREVKNEAGTTNKVLCSTLASSIDFTCEDLRRVVVNGVYWGFGLEAPQKADVAYVGGYEPSMYGTKDGQDESDPFRSRGFKRGVKPADLAIGK